MGAGWFGREHEAFGFPFPPVGERIDVLAEQVEIVHRLWGTEDVSFAGKHYTLVACPPLPRPVQTPHPPLIMGSGAKPRSLALAARWADEYDLVYQDPVGAKAAMDRVTGACEAIGRDPATIRRSLMAHTIVGADEDDLRRKAATLMAREGETGDVDAYLDDVRRTNVAGTVEQVLERLAAYAAAGIQRFLVQHLHHADLDSVELIGKEVIPEAASL
jgi:alkanesulfonate monooxygenase SsuD/methylene tetrahydromethanopterin reductase-like flavin-dependent oxidoreductase (luciferase family)